MPDNTEQWAKIEALLLQHATTKWQLKEVFFAFAAVANAFPDADFAKDYAKAFAKKCDFTTKGQGSFANYAAILTGLTSFALNRASLLVAIESSIALFKQNQQDNLLDGKFLIAWVRYYWLLLLELFQVINLLKTLQRVGIQALPY